MAISHSGDMERLAWPDIGSGLVTLCIAVLVAGRTAFHFLSGPLPDEAYYWLWGQRLALSYYDHPPLQAWLQAASTGLFGNTLFGLRAPTLLTTGWTLAVLAWWARRAGAPASTVTIAAVFFASPLIFVYTALAFHDHLLIALLVTAAAAFMATLDDAGLRGRVNEPALYTGALAIGLAMLTKYNAALFGAGVALAIMSVPRFRLLLRSPHLYAAAALAFACLTPVLVWNLLHDAASLHYNLIDRFQTDDPLSRTAGHVAIFLAMSVLALSPAAAIALWRMLRDRHPAEALQNWQSLATAAFAASTFTFLPLALFTPVYFYWNIPAYLAFLPYVANFMGRHLLALHLATGMLVAVAYPINYAGLPLAVLLGSADAESAMTYGWTALTARVDAERRAREADFLLASDYRIGSILAFHTGDTGTEVISERRSQFDFWFDEAARAGQDALILTDDRHPLEQVQRERFETIERVADIPVVRFGFTLKAYTLHVGRGYIPRPAVAP